MKKLPIAITLILVLLILSGCSEIPTGYTIELSNTNSNCEVVCDSGFYWNGVCGIIDTTHNFTGDNCTIYHKESTDIGLTQRYD